MYVAIVAGPILEKLAVKIDTLGNYSAIHAIVHAHEYKNVVLWGTDFSKTILSNSVPRQSHLHLCACTPACSYYN